MTPRSAGRDCEDSSEPGVGRSVNDLVEWLETAPGLAVSEPTPVTVGGGLEGTRLDIALAPTWKGTCFFSEGMPAVPLIFSGAELGGYHWTIGYGTGAMRWFILDSDDGVIIVNIEDDPGGLVARRAASDRGKVTGRFVSVLVAVLRFGHDPSESVVGRMGSPSTSGCMKRIEAEHRDAIAGVVFVEVGGPSRTRRRISSTC